MRGVKRFGHLSSGYVDLLDIRVSVSEARHSKELLRPVADNNDNNMRTSNINQSSACCTEKKQKIAFKLGQNRYKN